MLYFKKQLQRLSETDRTIIAGIILGGIFGFTIGVSYTRGFDLLAIIGVPLTISEIRALFDDVTKFALFGTGLGMLSGWLYASFFTRSWTAVTASFFILGFCILLTPIGLYILTPLGFILFLMNLGPAMIAGGIIVFLYQRLKKYVYLIPITVIAGMLATIIPWQFGGDTMYVNSIQRAHHYAQEHHLSNYQVEYLGRKLFETGSALHLEDGEVLECGEDLVDGEFVVVCEPFTDSTSESNFYYKNQ